MALAILEAYLAAQLLVVIYFVRRFLATAPIIERATAARITSAASTRGGP